jgi:RimJ/RimL family protein N-acetyltransferase
MVEIVAETARLVLRREAPGDLAAWLEHINTPEVMRRIGGVQSPERVAEGFARMAATEAEGALPFAFVALKADGTLIGKCGLARIETEAAPDELRDQPQIGWTLRAAMRARRPRRCSGWRSIALGWRRCSARPPTATAPRGG